MDEFDTVPVETPAEFQAEDEKKVDAGYPSFRYGPGGAAEIFYRAKDVPDGWEDHPSKVKEPKPDAPKLSDLRKQYKALTGKNPSPRATAEQLVEAIEAAEAEK